MNFIDILLSITCNVLLYQKKIYTVGKGNLGVHNSLWRHSDQPAALAMNPSLFKKGPTHEYPINGGVVNPAQTAHCFWTSCGSA